MSDFIAAIEALFLARIRGYYRIQPFLDTFRKQIIPDSIYDSPKKLNLGSSYRAIPTYINVDVLPERNPDIVCDISKLDFAADDEYDLVRASHVLEHFTIEQIPGVLAEWRRVLRRGGYFVVCVPNFRAIAWKTILQPSGFRLDSSTYANGWINGIFALDLPHQFRHQIVFTDGSLTELLRENGFKIVGKMNYRKEQPFTCGIIDDSCSLYSLNIVCQKI